MTATNMCSNFDGFNVILIQQTICMVIQLLVSCKSAWSMDLSMEYGSFILFFIFLTTFYPLALHIISAIYWTL